MSVYVSTGWLLTTLLVSIRFSAAIAFAPVFGPANIPGSVKFLIALALSAYTVALLPTEYGAQIDSIAQLIVAAASEALVGLSFGAGFMIAYAATQFAGRVLDIQIGFSAASVLNPATQGPAPLMGTVLGMCMIMSFLALDGHHLLIKALATSVIAAPPFHESALGALAVIQQSALMFTFGLTFASPVMFTLWMCDVTMAVFARSLPQLNVFVLSFAIKIVLGLAALALSIRMSRALFDKLFDSTFQYWNQLSPMH